MIATRRSTTVILFILLRALVMVPFVATSAVKDSDTVKLIDQLTSVKQEGYGYGSDFGGVEFLPIEGTAALSSMVLREHNAAPSKALREIVAQGIRAVPDLVKHLDDSRPTKIPPIQGMIWMKFSESLDHNRRVSPRATDKTLPSDSGKEPRSYQITVGDLVFVALGQIVNRGYEAAYYQPTAGVVITSPVRSPALRKRLVEEWSGLSIQKHQASLIQDLTKPDYDERRIDAYRRLAYYYPDVVEPLVLGELKRPTFDMASIWKFARTELYPLHDAGERRAKYELFLKQYGNAGADGLQSRFFSDLGTLEAHEEKRSSRPLTEFSTQPRELLHQLFAKPQTVRAKDVPYFDSVESSDQERFVEALTVDRSQAVTSAIRQIRDTAGDNDSLRKACDACLKMRKTGAEKSNLQPKR